MRPTKEIVLFYFSFNHGDFSRKTAGLSDKHKLAYLQLVSMYYENEEPIHNEYVKLSFRLGISHEEVFVLLNAFFDCKEDHWHDSKIDAAIAEYKSKQKTKSESGKLGAQARWKPKIVA
jgi:uncharacterized protein YdaU (DUF1376 family)